MKIVIFFIFLILINSGCKSEKEFRKKYQTFSYNIINIDDKIVDIKLGINIGRSYFTTINEYLLVTDLQSSDRGMHLFDKTTIEHIASTGKRGRGPGEIIDYKSSFNIIDNNNRKFYVFDFARLVIWKFEIDSILVNRNYLPDECAKLDNSFFAGKMVLLNDSMLIGKAIKVINNNTIQEVTSQFNIFSEKIEPFGYEHPQLKHLKDTRSMFNLSKRYKIYINCYHFQDLMTICDLEGNLKYNIYGPGWEKNKDRKKIFYLSGVDFYNDKILVSYVGKDQFKLNQHQRPKSVYPTKILIFDIKGNYLKTLETGHEISFFCVDEENHRIIAYFEDKLNPLAYIELNGLIDF